MLRELYILALLLIGVYIDPIDVIIVIKSPVVKTLPLNILYPPNNSNIATII